MRSAAVPRLRAWVWWAAAILFAGALGTWFRLYPLTVFPRDLSINTAKFMVLAQMRQAAGKELDRKEAGLTAAERTRRIESIVGKKIYDEPKEYNKLLTANARVLERQTLEATRGGFLLEVDPYYYLAQTRKILSAGRFADKVRGREFWNPMTLAPGGYWYPMDLHPYVGALLCRAASIVRPVTDPVAVVRWVPLMISLAVLGLFAWFCRRAAGITGWAGSLGLVYVMLCPMFLKRSLVGWYDTDPYNILFPLAAIAGIFTALGPSGTPIKHRWIGASAAGAAFGLHALFWRGWTIPYLVIFLFVLVTVTLPKALRPEGLGRRAQLLLMLPIALIPPVLILAVWGPLAVRQEAASAAEFIRGFIQPGFRPWPDVFITVGELKPMGFWRLTQLLGGPVWVVLAISGLALSIFRQVRDGSGRQEGRVLPLLVLLGITCVSLVVSVRIQRFAILAVAPLAASVPLAWAEWRRVVTALLPLIFAPHAADAVRKRMGILWGVLTLAAVLLLGARAHAEIARFYPIYNPAWDRMMAQVRDKTPQDSIVTAWWSPGHFLTSMGQRRVTFDGASQNEPQAYWVANLFIENSERMALGILRMLNTSGNASVDLLTSKGLSLSEAVDLVKAVLPLSREEARGRLLRRFSAADADGLLDLTHGKGDLPPSYLFVYNHMIEQALALEFIGRWNFKKAEAFEAYLKGQPDEVDKRLLSRATPQNTELLWALSEKPTFYESEGYEIGRDGDHLIFSNGVRLNLKTREAEIRGNPRVNGRPTSVFWVNDRNELIETPVAGPTLTVSVLLVGSDPKNGRPSYRSVIMGRRIAGSIGMRLYYLGGQGLRLLSKTAGEDSAMHRTRLGLFKADWEAFDRLLKGEKI
jgi:hypothetical protein